MKVDGGGGGGSQSGCIRVQPKDWPESDQAATLRNSSSAQQMNTSRRLLVWGQAELSQITAFSPQLGKLGQANKSALTFLIKEHGEHKVDVTEREHQLQKATPYMPGEMEGAVSRCPGEDTIGQGG